MEIILFDYDSDKASSTDSEINETDRSIYGQSVQAATSTSAAADTRPYLSDGSLPLQSMCLLSIRNILLLWFLLWFAFKVHFSIRNNIKKYHKTVGGIENE